VLLRPARGKPHQATEEAGDDRTGPAAEAAPLDHPGDGPPVTAGGKAARRRPGTGRDGWGGSFQKEVIQW